jgi:3-oxoisoapionate decarboxylase
MELGISTWSLPWSVGVPGYPKPPKQLDAFALVNKAAHHGVGVLQIADNIALHELPTSELDRLKMAAAAQDLVLEVGTRRGSRHQSCLGYAPGTKSSPGHRE